MFYKSTKELHMFIHVYRDVHMYKIVYVEKNYQKYTSFWVYIIIIWSKKLLNIWNTDFTDPNC